MKKRFLAIVGFAISFSPTLAHANCLLALIFDTTKSERIREGAALSIEKIEASSDKILALIKQNDPSVAAVTKLSSEAKKYIYDAARGGITDETVIQKEVAAILKNEKPKPISALQHEQVVIATQEELKTVLAGKKPLEFVKDAPIYGYQIKAGDTLETLPDSIRKYLGGVDQTTYTPAYFAKNEGSIIALQWDAKGGKPDLYIVGKDTFQQKYAVVGADQVSIKNKKLVDGLNTNEDMRTLLASDDSRIVGALKKTPTQMIRMSEAGFDINKEVKIHDPWGSTQTKPAGHDAYLVLDGDKVYMVQVGPDGNPISYIPK